MSLVWIKQLTNSSSRTITLKQNDPTYHPVLHSGNRVVLPESGHHDGSPFQRDIQVTQDKPIVVQPGGSFTSDWFVIPWSNSGRLLIEGGQANGSLEICVGPFGKDDSDYIHFVAKNGATAVPDVFAYDRGGHVSIEVRVNISEQGIVIEPINRTDFLELAKQLIRIAMDLWNVFNSKPAAQKPASEGQ
ncbi:hypothetical protein [Archangium violaceum]|uniref:hypothetical protein n=1 Tax=Archangium violaceum TaxID=83451 RepID=UPI0036D9FD42